MPAKTKPQTSRDQLVAALKPLLPRAWKLIPFSRNVDALTQTTVMVHATQVRPGKAMGLLEVDFTIAIMTPKVDPDGAQSDLDDDLLTLVHALDADLDWILFTEATPTTASGNLAWDINITVITRKE